jgi:hypothetical protein
MPTGGLQVSSSILQPANRLEDAYRTLSPEPLTKPDEFKAFYRPDVNKVRGLDVVSRLQLALGRAFGGAHFKALLMGHPGVGKSTELTRLARQICDKYVVIRFSATGELDPANFKPFDVLLLMMAEVASRTASPVAKGGAGEAPSDARLQEIWEWFAKETTTSTKAIEMGAEIAAGAGVTPDSLWGKMLGLFASFKGEIKYSADRKTDIVEYRLSRLSSLIELANRLMDDCNDLLRQATGKEWLFLGEDFDKPGIPESQVSALFLTYANIFRDLRTHLIFTIPITLGYSGQAVQLPFANDRVFSIPDTPVFDAQHNIHEAGRSAVRTVIAARIKPELFAEGQLERFVVASGGNLRDLFSIVSQAADNAILRSAQTIGAQDADAAMSSLRSEYVRRLGESPFDREPISYDAKAQRLLQVYNGDMNSCVPDAVLYSLLRARVLQEFNGERWYGVHPLVVDILKIQNRLAVDAPGGTQ